MKNQYGYYLTDQEFVEKWKQFPSPMLMANEIKISPRAIQNRRRSVEVRLGVKLDTLINPRDDHNKIQKAEKVERIKRLEELNQNRLEMASHNVRKGMAIDNGRVIIFSISPK